MVIPKYWTCFDECECGQFKNLKKLFSCIANFKHVLIDIISAEVREKCKYVL